MQYLLLTIQPPRIALVTVSRWRAPTEMDRVGSLSSARVRRGMQKNVRMADCSVHF